MDFSEIAALGGKGGLFKVFKPTRSGVILEGLKDKKKIVVGPSAKVSILAEISIYTTSEEGTIPLETVLKKIHEEFNGDIGLTGTADADELKAFLKHILPDYDEDRVYVSDIKKLVNWYNFLIQECPGVLAAPKEKKKSASKEKSTSDSNEEKK